MLDRQGKTVSPPTAAGASSDLTRLVETEARLDEMLLGAREEAARLVARAREDGVAREGTLAAEVEAAAHSLEETLTAEYQRRAADVAAEASREAERLDGVQAEHVAAVARYVMTRVIGAGP